MIQKTLNYIYTYPIESVAFFATLFPFLSIIYKMGYFHSKIKYLFTYLLFKIITDIIMFYLAIQVKNNLLIYNIQLLISYSLLSVMIYKILQLKETKDIIVVTAVGYYLFYIIDM